MVDPRRVAVLVRESKGYVDKTREVTRYEPAANGRIVITYTGGKAYPYGADRVRIVQNQAGIAPGSSERIEVDGEIWENATEISTFGTPDGLLAHIFYRTASGESWSSRSVRQVRIVPSATGTESVASVLRYWSDLVSRLDDGDPLQRVYESMSFVHPESVLAQYLTGEPIRIRELPTPVIYPFRTNLSQRTAVEHALTRSLSVIEGPPGTGKTETILNIIANIVVAGTATVGIVSAGNSAVDNVREKLEELGFGHVVARLGRTELMQVFLAGQDSRNAGLGVLQHEVPPSPPPERMADLDARVRHLQQVERECARLRQKIEAYTLERRHFEQHVEPGDLSQLDRLPLLRRSSDRILDYLAETALDEHERVGLVRRIRRYFKYGNLRGIAPNDTAVVLRLQRVFYDRRIAELTEQLAGKDAELRAAGFEGLVEEHRQLSIQALQAALGERYAGPRTTYDAGYRRRFKDFAADYPVILSTCHSLRANLPTGHLLDYLIIDEASQVDLLAAGAVLGSCRNLVVVGDENQLEPVFSKPSAETTAPNEAYDYRQSILASVGRVYADVPRTLLREHYRCDPAIIGFCNKAFYGGRLVPFTKNEGEQPMVVWRTVEGNHMRQYKGGGRSNQREVDVIVNEVIPTECAGVPPERIGVTAPYRKQSDKVVADLLSAIEADTVHRYQGRQKDIMIMTTVLDETWRGQTGIKFVDDPHLVNVAVSRAVRKFVLVTNHDLLSKSRHIRDLIGYIDYHALDAGVVDSDVVSVFDLLYRDYNERLQALAERLRDDQKYRSENIGSTLLHDILAEDRYRHLTVVAQVLLRNLMTGDADLTEAETTFMANRASVDFVIYNRITNRPVLAIEVDGFASHENNPVQLARDRLKDGIFRAHAMPLLRLPTTGSGEETKIRTALERAT